MKSSELIKEELIIWLKNSLQVQIDGPDEDMVTSRKMDSYSMLLLANHIAEEYGYEFELEKIDYRNFRTIDSIVSHMFRDSSAL